jgi:VWFA-related protein
MNFRAVVGFALATGLAALGARPATAQAPAAEPPPALFGERVDVEVVNVDVVVTDRSGRRITDLSRDDFELRIDGQPVAIEYFAAPKASGAVEAEPPALEAAVAPILEAPRTAPAPEPQSLLIVFVDQSALEVKASNRIVEEIREFVTPRLDGSVSVLIAVFVDALRVLVPNTFDPAVVEQALDELQEIRGRGSMLQNERHALEADIRSVMIAAPSDPIRRQQFLAAQRVRLENDMQAFGERAIDRQRRSVAALREWVNALAAIEGRKSLLLATNGVTSRTSEFLQNLTDAQLKGASAFSVLRESFSTSEALAAQGIQLVTEFEEMLRAAQNARVAFYTVSPRTPPVVQTSAEFGGIGIESGRAIPADVALVDAASSVVRMGVATGGGNLYLDDDLSHRLDSVVSDEESAYSLGFTTSETAGEKDHEIEVRVKREGLRLVHRESFRRRSLDDRVEQALAAAVALHAEANPLGIAIELGEMKLSGKRGQGATVPLLVKIPLRGLALVPEGGQLRGRLSARVAILDPHRDQRLGAPAPIAIVVAAADEPRVATHNWAYRAEMRLAPGKNRIAVVVVDELAGVIATTSTEIEVPRGVKG